MVTPEYKRMRLGERKTVHLIPYATFGTYGLCGVTSHGGTYDPKWSRVGATSTPLCKTCKKKAEKLGAKV